MHKLVYANILNPADTITINVQWPEGYNMTPPAMISLTDAVTGDEKVYSYQRTIT
jgi:hypothetical protein